jgi:hypothetical protein
MGVYGCTRDLLLLLLGLLRITVEEHVDHARDHAAQAEYLACEANCVTCLVVCRDCHIDIVLEECVRVGECNDGDVNVG